MWLLLIHTAGGDGSVALADSALAAPVVATESLPGRTASERLISVISRLLQASGWKLGELGAIAVIHGPGSFTGVRVGVAAAKGLSEAAGVPLIAISRLALLADTVRERAGSVYSVLDAGRGEFYVGEYADGLCVREELVDAEGLKAAVSQAAAVTSEEKVVAAMAGLDLPTPWLVGEPNASDALRIALSRAEDGAFDDAVLLDANYLRRTDLELFAKPSGSQ